jgi:hypothetical protein
MTDLIRTPRDGCFALRSNTWGQFLHPVEDPDANATLEADALKSFELHEGIARIPAELWSRWVQLCFHYAKEHLGNTEVSCRLLRHEDDKSQWRILIPVQAVDGASVRVESFDQAIDIATGEVIAEYPPAGWLPCGSSHSHNTMSAFFSGTDDKYELGDPGLHIVVGSIDAKTRKYTIAASITANKRRFLIDHDAVIDTTPTTDSYHPDALTAVSFDISPPFAWGLGAKAPSSSSVFFDPNAGNGYSRDRNRSSKHQQSLSDEADWGWNWDPNPAAIADDGPVAAAESIQAIFSAAINSCLDCGDNEGIDWLLASLHDLLDDTHQILNDTDDAPQSTDGALAAHPTAAGGLPTGEW